MSRQNLFDLIPFKYVLIGSILLMISLVTLGVNGYLVTDLNLRLADDAAKKREFGIWAVFQLDREVNTMAAILRVEMAQNGSYTLDEISERYQVLYSRIPTLQEGEYRINLQSDMVLSSDIVTLGDIVFKHMETIDGWVAAGVIDRTELAAATADISLAREMSIRLLQAFNEHFIDIQTAEIEDTRQKVLWSTGSVIFTLASTFALVILLIRLLKDVGESEQRAREAAKAAEAGNRAKSTFLATMSHEIRTPLNGLLGMIDVLDGSELDPDQQRQLATAQRSGDALLHIITDILDMSKLDANAVELETAPFQLQGLIESSIDLVSPVAAKKGISLRSNYEPIYIDTDQARLRQVLFNLVSNAVKFTDAGKVVLSASFKPTAGNRGVMYFEVNDTGIGISDEGKQHLFQEFSQVDNSISRRYGGTGLGLAISRKLVGVLGGEIGVESTPGVGSTFWFTVPVGKVEPEQADEIVPAYTPKNPLPMKVLVVEDNDTNRDVALAMLAQIGISADVATDGKIAVETATVMKYDLILMDMQMPNMDGLEATRILRSGGNSVPIIGLTGNASVTDREACINAGMDDYLSKPVNRAKLREMLDKWSRKIFLDEKTGAMDPTYAEVDTEHQLFMRKEMGNDAFAQSLERFYLDADSMISGLKAAQAHGDVVQVGAVLKDVRKAAKGLGLKGLAQMVRALEMTYSESGRLELSSLERYLSLQAAAQIA